MEMTGRDQVDIDIPSKPPFKQAVTGLQHINNNLTCYQYNGMYFLDYWNYDKITEDCSLSGSACNENEIAAKYPKKVKETGIYYLCQCEASINYDSM